MARPERIAFLAGGAALASLLCALLVSDVSAPTAPNPSPTPAPTAAPATPTPTAAPSATPQPTDSLSPTPTPLPAAVFVPADPLPKGLILPKGLYALLKGEGSRYDVLDATGARVHSFSGHPIFYAPFYTEAGLYTPTELSRLTRVGQDELVPLYPVVADTTGRYDDVVHCFANGYYQTGVVDRTAHVVLYDPSGKPVRTLLYDTTSAAYPTLWVGVRDDLTLVLVSFGSHFELDSYTVDGTGKGRWEWKGAGDALVDAMLGCSFGLRPKGGDLYQAIDEQGNVRLDDVAIVQEAGMSYLSVFDTTQMIASYVRKGDVLYGADLKPIPAGRRAWDGTLIPGISYDVAGIPCIAESPTVAVGLRRGRMGVLDGASSFTIAADGEEYVGTGRGVAVVVRRADGAMRGVEIATDRTLWTRTVPTGAGVFEQFRGGMMLLQSTEGAADSRIVSLRTGQDLWAFGASAEVYVGDGYFLVRTNLSVIWTSPENSDFVIRGGIAVIDGEGRLRYGSDTDFAMPTSHGAYIVLYRGSYQGIADLNGNWIVRSVRGDLLGD